MKLSNRAFPLMLATLLTGNLFLSSCKDDNNDPKKPSKPLLATMSYYREDGTKEEFVSYRYDTNGRVTEMNTDEGYKAICEYSPSTVTVKEYEEGELQYTQLFSLDAKGLAISSISDDGTTTYTYDENGYRLSSIEQGDHSTSTLTYTVSNQNYVTIATEDRYITMESSQVKKSVSFAKSLFLNTLEKDRQTRNILKSASDEIHTYKTDYSFYTDKANTIDFENIGIFFFGKQNSNPVKQEIETFSEGPGGTIDFTYEYDTRGRITKKTYSFGDYVVYTYVE